MSLLITYDAGRRSYEDLMEAKFSLHNGILKLEYEAQKGHDYHRARYYPRIVEARGDALEHLFGIVQNIPFVTRTDRPKDERSMVWHGDIAKFIVYNVPLDWRYVIKEHW